MKTNKLNLNTQCFSILIGFLVAFSVFFYYKREAVFLGTGGVLSIFLFSGIVIFSNLLFSKQSKKTINKNNLRSYIAAISITSLCLAVLLFIFIRIDYLELMDVVTVVLLAIFSGNLFTRSNLGKRLIEKLY